MSACQHPDTDEDDRCTTCGEDVQMYTSCGECEWFGIPIIDDGAPDKCNACLVAEHKRLTEEVEKAQSEEDRRVAQEAANECAEDLDFFFDRQEVLDPSQRRCKAMEEAA